MANTHDWRRVDGQYGQGFPELLEAGRQFWRCRGIASPPQDPSRHDYIFVELLTQDIRVNIRNLTVAAALSLETGASIVAVVGCDPTWRDVVFTSYDPESLTALAKAWGACAVLNVADFAQSDGPAPAPAVGDITCAFPKRPTVGKRRFHEILDSTYARILCVPTVDAQARQSPQARKTAQFAASLNRFWDALFTSLHPIAFVTSHVDYAQWALPVTIAASVGTPTLHVQSTGGLKAYYGLPRSTRRKHSYRRELTVTLGDFFEKEIWPHRDHLAQPADFVAWRARQNFGVPAWWRRDGNHDRIAFSSSAERASVREWTCGRWNIPADRPVIAVFNHAVSDALDGNHEAFDSLFDWFAKTAEFAAKHPEATWLFLDHPRQDYYDTTDSFGTLAKKFESVEHLKFMPSSDLTKNEIWSLTDLVVTTRGSVSNEFPAFGVPAVQAGWSEWSHCGFTERADTPRQYWRVLNKALKALKNGDSFITSDQVLRARLWMWFYRSGSDLNTGLVPHWHLDNQQRMRTELTFALTQPESDADPLFLGIHQWWTRRTPALMRGRIDDIASGFRQRTVSLTDYFSTSVDEPRERVERGERITSATNDQRIRLLTGWVPGTAVVGRINKDSAAVGLPLPTLSQSAELTLHLKSDTVTQKWREDLAGSAGPGAGETIVISVGTDERWSGGLSLPAGDETSSVTPVTVTIYPSDVTENGLVIVSLRPADSSSSAHAALGVELQKVEFDLS